MDLRWDDITDHLLVQATIDLDTGTPPRPALVGYEGEEPLAVVGLRPFGPGEVATALAELLDLLLPLGADRLALAVPGRAWSLDDPIPPVLDDVDLRRTVLTILTVDGHGHGRPAFDGWLFPYERDATGEPVWDAGEHVGAPEGPVTDTLRRLVQRPTRPRGPRPSTETVLRFARCVLVGHTISLSPPIADHLASVGVAVR